MTQKKLGKSLIQILQQLRQLHLDARSSLFSEHSKASVHRASFPPGVVSRISRLCLRLLFMAQDLQGCSSIHIRLNTDRVEGLLAHSDIGRVCDSYKIESASLF